MPTTDWSTRNPHQRHLALLGVAVLHALIATAWLAGRTTLSVPAPDANERRIQWLWLAQPQPPVRKPPPELEPALEPRPAVKLVPERMPRMAAPAIVPPPQPAPAPAEAPTTDTPPAQPALPDPAPAEPPAASVADLLSSARRMAGKVDKQLRKENHQPLPALVDTPYKRFVAELEAAHVAQWTGRPTITEIAMPGTGERIVKVSNGSSSYCLRVPSPSMGIDQYESARNAKPMTCPH